MFNKEDYKILRENMVEVQLKTRGIKDEKLLEVMGQIPRHLFVSEQQRSCAYEDFPLPIGEGQTISQPYMVALMTELLRLKEHEKVLEIGTGSGYQTAVLSKTAKEVYTVEKIESLALKAEEMFKELGYQNIKVKVGDGSEGWSEYAPYNGIIVTAGSPKIPEPLIKQLSENGRIVIPIGGPFSQDLILGEKIKGELITKTICGCTFVPLIGKHGWDK
ncbi:MAG: protein-L-isoaspartate(D-aspartate) O-methyltransferase [Candidatus Omnitrophica bacterium]|nr:protein-L-isoaspartate(D-aspartate) O-methyltransferase [Candidatus Omnitrophota bacterium]MBU1048019.1 protein-L-isoaspartate(D-aspartate) O-methyltransferase [Candidatus Omnitrophota bacterium]MBU1767118.1 protein-L-isoaspartate(D-aspartate) O-methyltransferase [Candidatus Omnitrophota bacterium]MBU1889389.1 protein-L-isoaspartate(D-aspartate) O-methyltransferase [Candidatus Omnitrophota bacterium]